MSIRIASFNVENLFDRPKVMNESTLAEPNELLDAYATLNALLQEPTYTPNIKQGILDELEKLGLLKSDTAEYAILRQNRGRLLKRSATTGVEVVAEGRSDWIGWVELTRERTNGIAMDNTARVIRDIDAQILGVIEAENRIALKRFTDAGLVKAKKPIYPQVMVIDGNDDRGIDVGILTKKGFPIRRIVSHVDDVDDGRLVFGRDCPEFTVSTPGGNEIIVLVNHLKSKGYGNQKDNNATRLRQAKRIAKIYRARAQDPRLRGRGRRPERHPGERAASPRSWPRICGTSPSIRCSWPTAARAPTATAPRAEDRRYVLLSPKLWTKVTGGAIFRMGVWGGVNGTLFPHYDTMTEAVHAASDHAAVYADVDLD